MIRLCFICTGNICRSPTAAGLMRKLLREEGLEDQVAVDGAGTRGWNTGAPPDQRSAAVAHDRGVELSGRARSVTPEDFLEFDYLLAMDHRQVSDLQELAPEPAERAKVHLLRKFDPSAAPDAEVPDPYAGGERGFEEVFEMCEAACVGLLEHLRAAQQVH